MNKKVDHSKRPEEKTSHCNSRAFFLGKAPTKKPLVCSLLPYWIVLNINQPGDQNK